MKPSVKLCQLIRCPNLWPWGNRCTIMGKVPGHMEHCPEKLLNSYEEIIEVLADLEHRQWIHWTRYMLDNLTPENIERWKNQIETPYRKLSDKEKESDHVWARKTIAKMLNEGYIKFQVVPKQKEENNANPITGKHPD